MRASDSPSVITNILYKLYDIISVNRTYFGTSIFNSGVLLLVVYWRHPYLSKMSNWMILPLSPKAHLKDMMSYHMTLYDIIWHHMSTKFNFNMSTFEHTVYSRDQKYSLIYYVVCYVMWYPMPIYYVIMWYHIMWHIMWYHIMWWTTLCDEPHNVVFYQKIRKNHEFSKKFYRFGINSPSWIRIYKTIFVLFNAFWSI